MFFSVSVSLCLSLSLYIYIYIYITCNYKQRNLLLFLNIIYIYIYIYIMFKKIAIRCAVYSSFHVTEFCPEDILYWQLRLEFFLKWRVSLFPLRLIAKPCLTSFMRKTYLSVHSKHSSVYVTWFAPLSHQNNMTEIYSSRALSYFYWPPFWIASKEIFFRD